MMDVRLLHPDHIEFPEAAMAWANSDFYPIGAVKGEGGEWFPLAIDRTRQPHAIVNGQPHALPPEEAGPALFNALEETCERLWGQNWNAAIVELFGINRRTAQRQRVATNLLPPKILMTIAYIASADDGPELARALVSYSRYKKWADGDAEVARKYWNNVADIYEEEFEEQMGTTNVPKV